MKATVLLLGLIAMAGAAAAQQPSDHGYHKQLLNAGGPSESVNETAQDREPSARDYYNELKAANSLNKYTDTYVCFHDEDIPSFAVISRGSDVIDEMKKASVTPDRVLIQSKTVLFVETYFKGVSNKTEVYDPVGKDGTDWDIEFNSPFHGKMVYSINWTTGRYRLDVYALDYSKKVPAGQSYGKWELIHPNSPPPAPARKR